VTYETAASFNRAWHRSHRRPPAGHKFSVGGAELKPRPGWDMPGRRRERRGGEDVKRIRWERVCNPGARPWLTVSRPADPDRADCVPPTLWEAS
jgi:hypothetical protein